MTTQTQPRQEALHAIFERAVAHDIQCQSVWASTYEDLRRDRQTDDANLNVYRCQIVQLCAAIAAAAQQRVPESTLLARGLSEQFDAAEDAEVDAFMRPIFEESGIGDRYVSDIFATYRLMSDFPAA